MEARPAMTDDETHPMTVFLYEVYGKEKVATFEPASGYPDKQWIFTLENEGFLFNLSVHDREGSDRLDIRSRGLRWIGHEVYNREMTLREPCERVLNAVDERVGFCEDGLDIDEIFVACTGCDATFEIGVMPKMDLVIDGYPAQRYFQEYCPECGEEIVDVKNYSVGADREYADDWSELDKSKLWEHSRRSV
jgi:hypothetical protein